MRRYFRPALIVGITLAGAWLLVAGVRFSVFDVARVSNESMLPFLKPGQIIVINKLRPCIKFPFTSLRFFCSPCETGRAYLFPHPLKPTQKLVKFAATPGAEATPPGLRRDIIWFTDGFQPAAPSRSGPASCYFEGSNREHSVDSRQFGAVPLENIDGKVVYPPVSR